VLFVGVAASSSFQHAVERPLAVGGSTRVGSYSIHYLRPTATITPKEDRAHTGSTLDLGAVIDVSKGGRHVATLHPSEGYYDSGEPAQGTVGHLIGGQAVSHISMNGGITRDVWTAIAPNISTPALRRIVTIGNRTLSAEEAPIAIAVLAREYLKHPPAAQFHFIVSPLVMWIWIGGLIVFGGGLIAIWPAPSAIRRRVALRSRSRAAHGLARA
jgi:cytochrome c-type biogenesis protein CcmF